MRHGIKHMWAYFSQVHLIFFENLQICALIADCLLIRESRVILFQSGGEITMPTTLGGIQQLRGQDEGGGGQEMSVFVHAQGIKTVHAWEGG